MLASKRGENTGSCLGSDCGRKMPCIQGCDSGKWIIILDRPEEKKANPDEVPDYH
jgi:hypothetical protein